jgi:hypothetical protein
MNCFTCVRSLGFSTTYLLASLFLLTCFAAPVRAQDLDEVTVGGRVSDENGAVIPGATVTLGLANTDVERTAISDAEGRYRLIELQPGTYVVRASARGFAVEEKRDLEAVAGEQVRLDFVLRPAAVSAEQTVVDEALTQAVDTSRTVTGGVVTGEEAESLPNNTRSPLDLIFTLPGVTEEPLSTRDLAEDRNTSPRQTPEEAGTFALSGSPAYSNNLTIDGLDNNDDRAARERFQPSLEAVAEVQVITNQFSAEYGRASGGRINIRTRGGSNKFHGRAFFFFRDDIFNANTFRNNSLGLKRLPLTELNPGFTLSGPIVIPPFQINRSGKSFFFIAYENTRVLDTALIDTLVPVEQSNIFSLPAPTTLAGRRFETTTTPTLSAEVAPFIESVSTPLINHIFTARVDQQFDEAHNGTFIFQLGRLDNLRQFSGGNRLAEALQGKTRNSDALSYTDNYVFSARLVNQARVQFSRLTPALVARGGSSPVVLISLNDSLGEGDPNFRTGTLVAGSSNAGGSDRRETRWQAQDTLSIQRGAHTTRLGADVQRIRSTFIDLSDVSGTFNFESAGDFLAGVPSRFRQNFMTESTQRNTYASFFMQDEWRLRPNVLLTFGLRYENETIVRDRNNFAPRVALAYDPFGDGKTVIRAGAGVFYNRALLRTLDDFTLGGQQLFFDLFSVKS